MREPVRNMGASVRARLLNIAKERNQPFDLLLTRYALERLLYRLSTTKYRERFVLKGAMLLTTWFDAPFRPTRYSICSHSATRIPKRCSGRFASLCPGYQGRRRF